MAPGVWPIPAVLPLRHGRPHQRCGRAQVVVHTMPDTHVLQTPLPEFRFATGTKQQTRIGGSTPTRGSTSTQPPVKAPHACPGLIFSVSKNDWALEGASSNPWLGVNSDAMRASGAACSSCLITGQWWRVLTALLIPAGIIHLISISFLISASSSVCARAGLPPGELITCMLVGGVIGSMTSAVAAPHTIHSTSGALAAAAASAAVAALLSVRHHVVGLAMPLFLALLWLATMLISCLAPFVDTWASLAGGLAGGLCAAAFMAPYASKVRTPSPPLPCHMHAPNRHPLHLTHHALAPHRAASPAPPVMVSSIQSATSPRNHTSAWRRATS